MNETIDAHQHFWVPGEREYSWLDESMGPLSRSFTPEELAPQLRSAGVRGTILVQSADTYEDTFYMLSVAGEFDFVLGVVGWVPLDRPGEAATALDRLASDPKFKGMRAPLHLYADEDWLVRSDVVEGLRLVAERDLVFEAVAATPRHLENVSAIAKAVPDLTLVIDHLGRPPIAEHGWEPWAGLLSDAASHDGVFAKISGLSTAADVESWSAADLQPYVDHALACFGPERLMFGSDWPVCTLAGDYQRILDETLVAIEGLSGPERAAILAATATHVYELDGIQDQERYS